MIKFEFGVRSSKYSVEAEDKLTAYSVMVIYYMSNPQLVALYEPREIVKNDSWLLAENVEERLDEVFGGEGTFQKYLDEHRTEIKECFTTLKQLV